MQFLTDKKRAHGLGSSRSGTHHHWQMMASSMALLVIVPLFVLVFGSGLGGSYEDVITYLSRPFPAIALGLCLIVGIWHVMQETLVAVEDYVPGIAGKITLVLVTGFSYTLMGVGLFAIAKIAL